MILTIYCTVIFTDVKIYKALKDFTYNAKLSQRIIYTAAEAKIFTVNFALVLNSMTDAFIKNKLMVKKRY